MGKEEKENSQDKKEIDWEDFDLDDFFSKTDEIGKILKKNTEKEDK